MVRHENPRVANDLVLLDHAGERPHEALAVLVVGNDGAAFVPASGDVV
jgi:hypothetical protein